MGSGAGYPGYPAPCSAKISLIHCRLSLRIGSCFPQPRGVDRRTAWASAAMMDAIPRTHRGERSYEVACSQPPQRSAFCQRVRTTQTVRARLAHLMRAVPLQARGAARLQPTAAGPHQHRTKAAQAPGRQLAPRKRQRRPPQVSHGAAARAQLVATTLSAEAQAAATLDLELAEPVHPARAAQEPCSPWLP